MLRHTTGWPEQDTRHERKRLWEYRRPEQRPTLNLWPEVGEILGLSKASVYAAAASGEIPTIRVGRRFLVPTAALRRMLHSTAVPRLMRGMTRAGTHVMNGHIDARQPQTKLAVIRPPRAVVLTERLFQNDDEIDRWLAQATSSSEALPTGH